MFRAKLECLLYILGACVMKNYIGCFMPVKQNNFHYVKLPTVFNNKALACMNFSNPYFCIENENRTVDFFLKSMFNSSIDEAKKFISPGFGQYLNLEMLQRCFSSNVNYKYLSSGNFTVYFKKYFVSSVLFMDKKSREESIINFYLVKQPDAFSNFKIYAIM